MQELVKGWVFLIIKLVRHGQSEVNAKVIAHGSIGDHEVRLTDLGEQQAAEAGPIIGADFFEHAIVYRSTYLRARQTCDILIGSITDEIRSVRNPRSLPKIYEDPRLREMDHGYDDVAAQEIMRKKHGWFYYRFAGGESPADCYDRCCHFLESMMRQIGRKPGQNGSDPNVLIVCHGMTMRCFVSRFMHLTPEQFETIANPKNCDVYTIASVGDFTGTEKKTAKYQVEGEPQFASGKWGINGLKFRPKEETQI